MRAQTADLSLRAKFKSLFELNNSRGTYIGPTKADSSRKKLYTLFLHYYLPHKDKYFRILTVAFLVDFIQYVFHLNLKTAFLIFMDFSFFFLWGGGCFLD